MIPGTSLHLPMALWRKAGSGRFGVIILLLLSCDLLFGYVSLSSRTTLFTPLNEIGLQAWLASYARVNPVFTAWFAVFLLLLLLLTINTVSCTWNRLRLLLQNWSGQREYRCHRLAIHVMHMGTLVILFAYLLSHTTASVSTSVTLVPGITVKDTTSGLYLQLQELHLPRITEKRLSPFTGRVIRPQARILIRDDNERRTGDLGYNKPLRFRGRSIFLQRFAPTGRGNMNSARYVVVDIRHDPGILLYFTGLCLFVAGMAVWSVQAWRKTS